MNEGLEAFIEIPIVHSVDIVAEKTASIKVSDFMEADFCNLKSDSGDITAVKIKAKSLNIETESGDIFCHGHIQVKTLNIFFFCVCVWGGGSSAICCVRIADASLSL